MSKWLKFDCPIKKFIKLEQVLFIHITLHIFGSCSNYSFIQYFIAPLTTFSKIQRKVSFSSCNYAISLFYALYYKCFCNLFCLADLSVYPLRRLHIANGGHGLFCTSGRVLEVGVGWCGGWGWCWACGPALEALVALAWFRFTLLRQSWLWCPAWSGHQRFRWNYRKFSILRNHRLFQRLSQALWGSAPTVDWTCLSPVCCNWRHWKIQRPRFPRVTFSTLVRDFFIL